MHLAKFSVYFLGAKHYVRLNDTNVNDTIPGKKKFLIFDERYVSCMLPDTLAFRLKKIDNFTFFKFYIVFEVTLVIDAGGR